MASTQLYPLFLHCKRQLLDRCIDVVDTATYLDLVANTQPASRATTKPFGPAPTDTKGSINMRIEARTRALIDQAAAVLGKTRTEFMIDSARAQAIDVLLDQRLFALEAERFDRFAQALDQPAPPGPKLRALLARKPAWSG